MRIWFGLCAGLCAAALAGPPAAPPTGAPAPSASPTGTLPSDPAADDELIEFLGADDVGDAAWWEFLKNSAPDKSPPKPTVPPQDAKS